MRERGVSIVYLAWAPAGIDAFASFLESLAQYPPEIGHRLLILYKGFTSRPQLDSFARVARDTDHDCRLISDVGLDIRSYLRAARSVDSDYFCFLNSYSEILARGWLAMLMDALMGPGIFAVGATGSWESFYTGSRLIHESRRSPTVTQRIKDWVRESRMRVEYPPWPNPHLRTNCLVIPKARLLEVRVSGSRTKRQDHRFESGRHGLTRQLERHGGRVRVVGRNGQAYAPEDWAVSNTYRRPGQENLLVSDNRTRQYSAADARTRASLELVTWGPPPTSVCQFPI